MSRLNLDISPWQVVWPRVVLIVGLVDDLCAAERRGVSCTFPRNCAARPSVCSRCLRNEGGSVGTSVGKIILERREQFHTLRLNESLDPLNPAVTPYLQQRPRRSSCSRPAIRSRSQQIDAAASGIAARPASAVAGVLRRLLVPAAISIADGVSRIPDAPLRCRKGAISPPKRCAHRRTNRIYVAMGH